MTNDSFRNLVLIAVASDDELLETLVLKGGNAISLLERGMKNSVSRASYDLDYSMEYDFGGEIDEYKQRIQRTLAATFDEHGFAVIDYVFKPKPSKALDAIKDFWGGYNIQFKVVKKEVYDRFRGNVSELRKYAEKVLPNGSSKIEIEISKCEFVGNKMQAEVEGYTIFIYSPEMIVFEKLRAICQQHPQYAEIIPSHAPRPRARDFYDIYTISTLYEIDFEAEESRKTIAAVFAAKKVPLRFTGMIKENSDIHRSDWQSVVDTVSAKEEIKDFDFYLDYLLKKLEGYIPLG